MTSVPYPDNIAYTAHAVQQMDQRGIAKNVVEKALANGEVIEEYETDEEARYLVHWNEEIQQYTRHIHMVAADQAHGRTVVITAYDPRSQADRWSNDFRTRVD